MTDSIEYFFEDIDPLDLDFSRISEWITHTTNSENKELKHLNYIFCSDEYLLEINKEYLSHDYYTDIITFDNSEAPNDIEGDIFISVDRVYDNANSLNTDQDEELRRVIIHGLLHLIGYNDKTDDQQITMTEKENAYLSLPHFKL